MVRKVNKCKFTYIWDIVVRQQYSKCFWRDIKCLRRARKWIKKEILGKAKATTRNI